MGRPSGLGRPGPDWDNRNFECPSSDWDGPAGWVVPARPGLSHLAGLSQFGWVVSLGWVVPARFGSCHVTRTHIRRRDTGRTHKVHPRAVWHLPSVWHSAQALALSQCRTRYTLVRGSCLPVSARVCLDPSVGRRALGGVSFPCLQFSCSKSSSKTTGWTVTLRRFAFLPGWGTGCGFL